MAIINGTSGIDMLKGTNSVDTIKGYSGNDFLYGYGGNDKLYGGTGIDTMSGGLGNDWYFVDRYSDITTETSATGGYDTVFSTVSRVLGANLEKLVLQGTAAINGKGNSLNNQILGNTGNNYLFGYGGRDYLQGGAGNDTLNGGLDNDRMNGGSGNDRYIVNHASDMAIENSAGGGTDLVLAYVSWTLGPNFENLTLKGSGAIDGTGNDLANTIMGNSGNNMLYGMGGNDRLDGGAGNDTMDGGAGNDIYYVDSLLDKAAETSATGGTDTVFSSAGTFTLGNYVENLTLQGTGNIVGIGNTLNNVITGNSASNALNGLGGADTMRGGGGDDHYYVDNSGDVVTEMSGAGTDRVHSSISHTLGDNVEYLYLTGTASINGTGNTLNNRLYGNSGNNVLNGRTGADYMSGSSGNDSYYVDNSGDTVVESSSGGSDWVNSSITYTLGNNVEHLRLLGSTNIRGYGNTLGNIIYGNSGGNYLSGLSGSDTIKGYGGNDYLNPGSDSDTDRMYGGTGNDCYYVYSTNDYVYENSGEGTDYVGSYISYTLGSNVENLTLSGTSHINGTGNALNNYIYGNSGNNVLNGGAGADRMSGSSGDDRYYVDNTGDVITEYSGNGTDSVYSSISHTLSNNVERLYLTGTASINGTGNTLDNTLIGNTGNNRLTGGTGADYMSGLTGNDYYYVDNTGDTTYELSNSGDDRVYSSVSWTLGNNLERLYLTGTASINGTGNSLDNYIAGNHEVNRLSGSSGNDQLLGGGDNDTLYGGEGHDTLNGGSGADAMYGSWGNDTYYVDNISDITTETSSGSLGGYDTVVSSVSKTLGNNIERLYLTGTANISGFGNSLENNIYGNEGINSLFGYSGNDFLIGDSGNDFLYGDGGNDTLEGGLGADRFVFRSTLNPTTNNDIISDFSSSQGDKIVLDNDIFTTLGNYTGTLYSYQFKADTVTDSNDRIYYNSTSGNLYYDTNGASTGGWSVFANLDNKASLSYTDFTVAG